MSTNKVAVYRHFFISLVWHLLHRRKAAALVEFAERLGVVEQP